VARWKRITLAVIAIVAAIAAVVLLKAAGFRPG
jgi:hypothetical protein